MPPQRRQQSAEHVDAPRETNPAPRPATEEQPAQKEVANYKVVYTVVDRGNGRSYWLRIGVAFVNRDQSLNGHRAEIAGWHGRKSRPLFT